MSQALFCNICETWLYREWIKITVKTYKLICKSTKPWNCDTFKEKGSSSIMAKNSKKNKSKTEITIEENNPMYKVNIMAL